MPPHGASLLADITNDGLVTMKDFAAQALYWMTAQSRQPGDLNRDGLVNAADLVLLAEDWLKQKSGPPAADLPIEIEAKAWDFDGLVSKISELVTN